jgi:hypothetical protein
MRSILRATKNVVEQNTTKGAARLVFCGTRSRRTGGGAVTVCYALVCLSISFLNFWIIFSSEYFVLLIVFNPMFIALFGQLFMQ